MEHVIASNQGSPTASPLYRAPRVPGPWARHHLWYQATPQEVHTTNVALGLISECARFGMNVMSLPALIADAEPDYIEKVTRAASRRGVRLLPHVGADVVARAPALAAERYAILNQWFDHGAYGVELGTIDLTDPEELTDSGAHIHAGWDTRELLAYVESHQDAIVSANVRSTSFAEASTHALEDFFDVVRFQIATPHAFTPDTFPGEVANILQFFEIAGAIPSWNCSFDALENRAGNLSEGAILLASCFFPGFLHFEQNIPGRSPSVRHALRLRNSLSLHHSSILISTDKAADGFIWLVTDKVSMLLNFGPYPYLVPNDGRVLVSSLIELPEEGTNLVIPPGEAAWLRR
ncbi:hypothetical protein HMPREF3167_02645 [Trueperella sp. HMSC08B05]|nr:hypothetical protein HMPREF3167_02645 [Trueperella sp. HMSC08B05]PKZ89825.1 hypothetical protein CYK24_01190 [Trueperella bernardiae]